MSNLTREKSWSSRLNSQMLNEWGLSLYKMSDSKEACSNHLIYKSTIFSVCQKIVNSHEIYILQ